MIDATIKGMLEAEIQKTLEEVSKAKTGSKESLDAMDKLNRLYTQHIKETEATLKDREVSDRAYHDTMELEQRKAEADAKLQQALQELSVKKDELAVKEEELKEAKRGRRWRTALDILGIGLPAAVTCYWMKRGLEFEESGKLYSSRTAQWLSQHLRLPGKKG